MIGSKQDKLDVMENEKKGMKKITRPKKEKQRKKYYVTYTKYMKL